MRLKRIYTSYSGCPHVNSMPKPNCLPKVRLINFLLQVHIEQLGTVYGSLYIGSSLSTEVDTGRFVPEKEKPMLLEFPTNLSMAPWNLCLIIAVALNE